MDAKRGSDENNGLMTSLKRTGSRPAALLLGLLMLVGVFSCDRNSPQSEQKPAEITPPVTKMPLPQHGDQVSKAVAPAVNPDSKVSAPATTAAPKAAPAPAVPQARELPKKVEPKMVAAAAPGGKKPLPAQASVKDQKVVAPAKPEPQKKPSGDGKAQPAQAGKKVASVAGPDKIAAVTKKPANKEKAPLAAALKDKKPAVMPENKVRPEANKASAHVWTVVVGTYLLEDAMAPDLIKVRKAGLEAAVKPGARKRSTMNRLLLAEYPDAGAAQAQLDKLKLQTSDAFVLTHGGKHFVYAGSYLLDNDAASEKERLAAAGFSLTLKRVSVAIPSKMLTAGSFDDRKAAEEAAGKLKEAGLKATVVRQ